MLLVCSLLFGGGCLGARWVVAEVGSLCFVFVCCGFCGGFDFVSVFVGGVVPFCVWILFVVGKLLFFSFMFCVGWSMC